MADLRKKVLGTVSGAVGDILFRTKHGRNYVGTRPLSFTPGTDEKSIARRKRFGMATRLARPINSIYRLKALWKAAAPVPLHSYNMIVRANYSSVGSDSISNTVKLVPEIGFSVQSNNLTLDENHLRVTLDGLTSISGINPAVETFCQIVGIIHLSSPVDPAKEPHVFIPVVSIEQALALNTEINDDIIFQDVISQLNAMYQNRKAFLTVLTLDTERNVIHYSNTFFTN
jgi:hypothetical protein